MDMQGSLYQGGSGRGTWSTGGSQGTGDDPRAYPLFIFEVLQPPMASSALEALKSPMTHFTAHWSSASWGYPAGKLLFFRSDKVLL